jgi:hypothetical protein
MYCLIDCTNYQALATSDSYISLSCLAYIQFANVDTAIFDCGENRPFAQFTSEQLDKIATGVLAGMDTLTKTATYTDAISRCRELINSAKHLVLPFDPDNLGEQAEHIKPDDDQPYVIATDGKRKPLKAKAWTVPPNVNRTRYANPSSPQLTRHEGTGPATVPQPPSSVAGTRVPPPPPTPAPPKPPRAPKPPAKPRADVASRPIRNGIRRPAPGSKTSVPWDVADAISAKRGSPEGIRELVLAECKKRGCNPNMANANFRVWCIFHDVPTSKRKVVAK